MKLFYTGPVVKMVRINRRLVAFTLIEVITIIVIVFLVAFVLLPALIHAKQKSQRQGCVNNLKQVGLSFRLWSTDGGDQYPMGYSTNQHGTKEYIGTGEVFRHFQTMSNELASPSVLVCPADTRQAAQSFVSLSNSNLSYFVGVDIPDETMPQMILSGDRNLVLNGSTVVSGLLLVKSNDPIAWGTNIHKGQGSVATADGSVQFVLSPGLAKINASTGVGSNRLAIP